MTLDLDAYLERIQWGDEARPTLACLTSLLGAHMARIPFENLDVLCGRTPRLDLEGVEDKLVRRRRGGYCFEHGTLFAAALERLGFRPLRHIARVTLFVPLSAAPQTHMFLTVPVAEGTFVVDPGFGSLAARVPVPLDGSDARIGREAHALGRDGRHWVMRADRGAARVDCWYSTMDEVQPIDYDVGNHYTATHPSSSFVNRLMMRALTPDGRVGVANRDVTTWVGGESHSRVLGDRADLRALLVEHFGFDLPGVDRLRVPTIPEWD